MAGPEKLTFSALALRWCEQIDCTPSELLLTLHQQRDKWTPKGWFLAECQMLDSSQMGRLNLLPYGGPENTFKEVPTRPFSPKGLASDMSVAVGFLLVEDLPDALPEELKGWQPPPPPKKKGKK